MLYDCMLWTKTFIPTLREDPAEAEIRSHSLLLRAGFIRKLVAGAYTYLPLGFRTLNKVIGIVREEMDRAGACEVLMPAMHPEELWAEGPRLEAVREILITFRDRGGRKMLLGPTHEEVVTDLVRKDIRSYRQLPVTLYQIQTKFRDELRPRFGILRSREFIMKDGYSFDADWEGLDRSYDVMYEAYCRIFNRCGIDYTIVEADTGVMGGDVSHEFMVPCANGEDRLVSCAACGYAANMDKASGAVLDPPGAEDLETMEEVETPGTTTIEAVSRFLEVNPDKLLKTLIYKTGEKTIAVLVRGDHTINEAKLVGYLGMEVEMADEATIEKVTGGPVGFSGPVGLDIRIVADRDVAGLFNMVTGANRKDTHIINVNSGRDYEAGEIADIRFVEDDDRCAKCGATLSISNGIEVGHVFKLGTKYSETMGAVFRDEAGEEKPIIMGCYGIGINRIMASAAEICHDEKGLVWPDALAPYLVHIVSVKHDDDKTREAADNLHGRLTEAGIDVLMDDREARAGVKFNDADLIGIPIRVTIGPKALKDGCVEIKRRTETEVSLCPVEECVDRISSMLE